MMKLVLRFDWVNWKYKISKNIILEFFDRNISMMIGLGLTSSFRIKCILPFQNNGSEAFIIHCTGAA